MKLKDLNSQELKILEGIIEYGVELSLILKDNILLASNHNRKEIFILKKELRKYCLRLNINLTLQDFLLGKSKEKNSI